MVTGSDLSRHRKTFRLWSLLYPAVWAVTRLDALVPPVAPLDILAQQVVAEAGAEEWGTDELYDLMRTAFPYRDLSREDYDVVTEQVCDGIMTGRGRRAAWVHHDTINFVCCTKSEMQPFAALRKKTTAGADRSCKWPGNV